MFVAAMDLLITTQRFKSGGLDSREDDNLVLLSIAISCNTKGCKATCRKQIACPPVCGECISSFRYCRLGNNAVVPLPWGKAPVFVLSSHQQQEHSILAPLLRSCESQTLRLTCSPLRRIPSHLLASLTSPQLPSLQAMCFLRPTRENMTLLTRELKDPRFGGYHICRRWAFKGTGGAATSVRGAHATLANSALV